MAFMLELNDDHTLTTRFDCTFKGILHISRLTENNNKPVFSLINNGNKNNNNKPVFNLINNCNKILQVQI